MKDAPSFVTVTAALGESTRATMLNALMHGKALTATELGTHAGVTKATASAHLRRLLDAGLLLVRSQGRHRYYQLADPQVALMLESIMGVAQRTRSPRAAPGPRDPALRRARRCYDHLAGGLAVELYDHFVGQGFLVLTRQEAADTLALSDPGEAFFNALGIDVQGLGRARRPVCRPCLDWSARRYHLAGGLGKALLEYCYAEGFARRSTASRVVKFSPEGERRFRRALLAE